MRRPGGSRVPSERAAKSFRSYGPCSECAGSGGMPGSDAADESVSEDAALLLALEPVYCPETTLLLALMPVCRPVKTLSRRRSDRL